MSTLISVAIAGPACGIALRSAPAQNIRPAPVSTTQRISGSSSQRIDASISSSPIFIVSAFAASGRLSVIVATPSLRSQANVS